MLSATVALVAVFALLALYIYRSVRTYYALKDFGGHWSCGWSRLWMLRTQGSGQMNKIFTETNLKYGEFRLRRTGLHQSWSASDALERWRHQHLEVAP